MSIDERIKAFNAELDELLKKHELTMGAVIEFPLYKKLPAEVLLCLEILKKHEAAYKIAYREEKKDAN